MNTSKNTHNTLITKGFTPPYSHIDASEGKPHLSLLPSTLLHTAAFRVGRVSLFLLVALMALTFACCTKDEGGNSNTDSSNNASTQYNEDYWDWDKSAPSGFIIDSAWDGDTTINF
ncbi:MAG: hypothetical protein IKQ53_04385 [Bacteroidales bacterium]|nr:hypothetical protein [Bacteroidales bacterium]